MNKVFSALELYKHLGRSPETEHMFLDYIDYLVDTGELTEAEANDASSLSVYLR